MEKFAKTTGQEKNSFRWRRVLHNLDLLCKQKWLKGLEDTRKTREKKGAVANTELARISSLGLLLLLTTRRS